LHIVVTARRERIGADWDAAHRGHFLCYFCSQQVTPHTRLSTLNRQIAARLPPFESPLLALETLAKPGFLRKQTAFTRIGDDAGLSGSDSERHFGFLGKRPKRHGGNDEWVLEPNRVLARIFSNSDFQIAFFAILVERWWRGDL
jgi:hypothetical protein